MSTALDPAPIVAWLLSPEGRADSAEELVRGLVARWNEAGLEPFRVTLGVTTKHPEVFVRRVVWIGGNVETTAFSHETMETGTYLDNPVAALRASKAPELRVDLTQAAGDIPYPVCRELKAAGGKDYLALVLPFSEGHGTLLTLTTAREGGFRDDELTFLRAQIPALSLRAELESSLNATRSLLRTYLGRNASQRVLEGEFRRGSGEKLTAVIWMCDLRGFTTMMDTHSTEVALATLDAYLGCVAEPILAHGGEILKYIGDAVLGVWTTDGAEDPGGRAAAAALAAADDAFARVARANVEREEPLRFGIALHLGEVMYGNIGATGRLDFTVIGSAVNETSRVEGMCKTLGAPLLLTSKFADAARLCPRKDELVSLGTQTLRGVAKPVELHTLQRFLPLR